MKFRSTGAMLEVGTGASPVHKRGTRLRLGWWQGRVSGEKRVFEVADV